MGLTSGCLNEIKRFRDKPANKHILRTKGAVVLQGSVISPRLFSIFLVRLSLTFAADLRRYPTSSFKHTRKSRIYQIN